MRAITVSEYGAKGALAEVPDPRPGPVSGQFLIAPLGAAATYAATLE